MEGLSPQERVLRTFDDVASLFLALARERPLALLLDDLQWADDDSTQLIRYLVRTLATGPLALVISLRPHSYESSAGIRNLIADLDRMRVTHVLRLHRLTRLQTGELLENLLAAPVDESTVESLHARSEGVPFFIEELARAYREAEALQLIDGTWTMTRLSGPAVPSSIQSLIERRLAQLPDDRRGLLADAAVLGRRFRLSDLSRVLATVLGEAAKPDWQLGEDLQRAVGLGLLGEEPASSPYDLSFAHDQIRESLLGSLSKQRRRAIHGAVAQALTAEGGSDHLSLLAYHALQAGDQTLATASALAAARAAMAVSAREEAIRLIDATLPAASRPEDRIEMLLLKDDAFKGLDRPSERLANLAELTALTAAVPSSALHAEVKLRRASASRANEDYDTAADLARAVLEVADRAGDRRLELGASFELGQALTRSPVGEAYLALVEIDLDASESTYRRALELARELGDRSKEADALRELAMIESGRVKKAAIAAEEGGTPRLEILFQGPELFARAKELAEQAFHLYQQIGDKRGAMSSLISMAYFHVTDPTARGMAGRIEHIRALHHNRAGEVTESQRAIDDAAMLYSISTYARLNLEPGLALQRGREGFEAARALGDRWLECLCAGGVAMTYLSFGAEEESRPWLDRAADAAMAAASASMARRVDMWRGAHAAARDDLAGVVAHFERAADSAGQKYPGIRCEAYSTLAYECARIGVNDGDDEVLDKAKEAADETLKAVRHLSGKLPWEAEAHAVLSLVAQARGDAATAAAEARAALDIDGETFLVHYLHALWAAGRALIVPGEPEAAALSAEILAVLGFLTMAISEPDIRAKWLQLAPVRELAEIVGFDPSLPQQPGETKPLTEAELGLLREMALRSVTVTSEQAGELLAKLGVDSEAGAIEYAIKAGVAWQ